MMIIRADGFMCENAKLISFAMIATIKIEINVLISVDEWLGIGNVSEFIQ